MKVRTGQVICPIICPDICPNYVSARSKRWKRAAFSNRAAMHSGCVGAFENGIRIRIIRIILITTRVCSGVFIRMFTLLSVVHLTKWHQRLNVWLVSKGKGLEDQLRTLQL